MMNSNYIVQKLEKELAFADTFNNRVRLADAYVENGLADKAIELYKSCLEGVNADDPYLLSKLVRAFFIKKNYAEAIRFGDLVKDNKEFKKSQERVAYAWALHYQNQSKRALEEFEGMDMPYSNFPQRVEYARFLIEVGEKDHAKSLIKELSNEYRLAEGLERKLKRPYYNQLKELESKV